MKILISEDNAVKAEKIQNLIKTVIDENELELIVTETVNDTLVNLAASRFDLVIVDLVMPQVLNATPADATVQWCEMIENHLSGRTASWIVMTGFVEVAHSARESFARHAVVVIHYDNDSAWEKTLTDKLKDNYATRPLDFVVVCALSKERKGYEKADCDLGDLETIAGLDCQRMQIGPYRGVIVVQPAPGMISAAIITMKALNAFRPRAVAMSGICGGRTGETKLGALIVPEISWNYQSGKFVNGELTPDLLQVKIPPNIRTAMCSLVTEERSLIMREGLMHSELLASGIQMQNMVSGSQVVADETVGAVIGDQGRKVAGIDMEVASVFFAAHDFFDGSGIFFAAKVVVDLANPAKDDRYHEYGCALSARFVVNTLATLLAVD